MKNLIYLTCTLLLFFQTACVDREMEGNADLNPNRCSTYVCPMHQDKTAFVEAACPECNMLMVKNFISQDLWEQKILQSKHDTLAAFLNAIADSTTVLKGDTETRAAQIMKIAGIKRNVERARNMHLFMMRSGMDTLNEAQTNPYKKVMGLYAAVTYRLTSMDEAFSLGRFSHTKMDEHKRMISEAIKELEKEQLNLRKAQHDAVPEN